MVRYHKLKERSELMINNESKTQNGIYSLVEVQKHNSIRESEKNGESSIFGTKKSFIFWTSTSKTKIKQN